MRFLDRVDSGDSTVLSSLRTSALLRSTPFRLCFAIIRSDSQVDQELRNTFDDSCFEPLEELDVAGVLFELV